VLFRSDGIQPWFHASLRNDSLKRGVDYKDPSQVTKMMGFEYVANWQNSAGGTVYLSAASDSISDVSGFDRMLRVTAHSSGRRAPSVPTPSEGLTCRFSSTMDTVRFALFRGSREVDSLQIDIQPFLTALLKDYGSMNGMSIPPGRLSLRSGGSRMNLLICFQNLQVERRDGEVRPTTITAEVFYAVREAK
jgi:hypothetical protein